MKTVFDAMQRLNSLDTKIEMLECMDEEDTMLIKDADREEIIDLLREYRVFLYEMKVTQGHLKNYISRMSRSYGGQ